MLLEIESAIAKRLSLLDSLGVRTLPFPDSLKELGRPVVAGQVLISYKSSSFQTLTTDPFSYEQLLQFEINSQLRGLRTHAGIYPLLDQIRLLLAGWYCGSPNQKRPAYFQSERFLAVDEGMWSYTQTLVIPIVLGAGAEAEFTPNDPLSEAWERLARVEIITGLWCSPIDAVGEASVSTKDIEIQIHGGA